MHEEYVPHTAYSRNEVCFPSVDGSFLCISPMRVGRGGGGGVVLFVVHKSFFPPPVLSLSSSVMIVLVL